jgi:hypothetical protein
VPPTPCRLRPEPASTVMQAFRKRIAGQDLAAVGVTFELRMAAQQFDNTLTDCMAGTPAAFSHPREVSGPIAGLERDGLVRSNLDRNDRRNLIATLTSRGRAIVEKATESSIASLRAALASLSTDELRR